MALSASRVQSARADYCLLALRSHISVPLFCRVFDVGAFKAGVVRKVDMARIRIRISRASFRQRWMILRRSSTIHSWPSPKISWRAPRSRAYTSSHQTTRELHACDLNRPGQLSDQVRKRVTHRDPKLNTIGHIANNMFDESTDMQNTMQHTCGM